MRVAMLAPTAADAFRGQSGVVGGAERQLLALAKGLVERGHEVDVIIAGTDAEPEAAWSGCRLWPCMPLSGLPLIKNLHPKGSALWRCMRRTGSDLLIQRGAADLSGLGRAVTRLLGRPFLYAVASASDLQTGQEIVPHLHDRLLYRLGAGGADLIVTQTAEQARAALSLFGAPVVRIPSFVTGTDLSLESMGEGILWIGNLRPVKRPEWILTLAAALPEERFIVVGGPAAGYDRYTARMLDRFEALDNIDYRGRVSPDRLGAIYAEADILLNTSLSEGFPNTFLEAWSRGLEVVASVDPDGLMRERRLGSHGDGPRALREAIRALRALSPVQREERRGTARQHLARDHSRAKLLDRWEQELAELLEIASP